MQMLLNFSEIKHRSNQCFFKFKPSINQHFNKNNLSSDSHFYVDNYSEWRISIFVSVSQASSQNFNLEKKTKIIELSIRVGDSQIQLQHPFVAIKYIYFQFYSALLLLLLLFRAIRFTSIRFDSIHQTKKKGNFNWFSVINFLLTLKLFWIKERKGSKEIILPRFLTSSHPTDSRNSITISKVVLFLQTIFFYYAMAKSWYKRGQHKVICISIRILKNLQIC